MAGLLNSLSKAKSFGRYPDKEDPPSFCVQIDSTVTIMAYEFH
jgi:hypothetical protein